MQLTKCRLFGCTREMLDVLQASASSGEALARELVDQATRWLGRMTPIRCACLGYEHCFPAVALNALAEAGTIDA